MTCNVTSSSYGMKIKVHSGFMAMTPDFPKAVFIFSGPKRTRPAGWCEGVLRGRKGGRGGRGGRGQVCPLGALGAGHVVQRGLPDGNDS